MFIFQVRISSQHDDKLIVQVPEKYREDAKKLLNELNKRSPTQQERQMLIGIINIIVENDDELRNRGSLDSIGGLLTHPAYGADFLNVIHHYLGRFREDPHISDIFLSSAMVRTLDYLKISPDLRSEILKTIDTIIDAPYYEAIDVSSEWRHANSDVFSLGETRIDSKFLSFIQAAFARGDSLDFLETNRDIILKMRAYLDKAKEFAEKNLRMEHPTSEIVGNIVWAFDKLGEDKTKALYEDFGIVYFSRYGRNTLEEAYKNRNSRYNSDKLILLVIFNKNDSNGAFYLEGKNLEQLTKAYKVIIMETDTEEGFYQAVEKTSKHNGGIDVLIVGGHGNPEGILLGTHEETGTLDLTDENEMKERVAGRLKAGSTIILVSCSVGESDKSFAAMLSGAADAEKVYAPTSPTYQTKYHLTPTGRIDYVDYHVTKDTDILRPSNEEHIERAEFKKGNMQLIPKKAE